MTTHESAQPHMTRRDHILTHPSPHPRTVYITSGYPTVTNHTLPVTRQVNRDV